jgi:hypothetical protein
MFASMGASAGFIYHTSWLWGDAIALGSIAID